MRIPSWHWWLVPAGLGALTIVVIGGFTGPIAATTSLWAAALLLAPTMVYFCAVAYLTSRKPLSWVRYVALLLAGWVLGVVIGAALAWLLVAMLSRNWTNPEPFVASLPLMAIGAAVGLLAGVGGFVILRARARRWA